MLTLFFFGGGGGAVNYTGSNRRQLLSFTPKQSPDAPPLSPKSQVCAYYLR